MGESQKKALSRLKKNVTVTMPQVPAEETAKPETAGGKKKPKKNVRAEKIKKEMEEKKQHFMELEEMMNAQNNRRAKIAAETKKQLEV